MRLCGGWDNTCWNGFLRSGRHRIGYAEEWLYSKAHVVGVSREREAALSTTVVHNNKYTKSWRYIVGSPARILIITSILKLEAGFKLL